MCELFVNVCVGLELPVEGAYRVALRLECRGDPRTCTMQRGPAELRRVPL